jgi:uncharacterized protein YuzE
LKIRYDAEADVLLFVLRDIPPVDAVEEPGGIIVSYGKKGVPVSVEFLSASKKGLVENGNVSIILQTKSA